MKNERGFVQNIVMIAVLLAVVFLSQQRYARPIVQNAYAQASNIISPYITKTTHSLQAGILPKVSGEVAKRGDTLQEAVVTQKNSAAQTTWENIKNFFAEKFSTTFGTKVK
jgi:uncharacterized membrane protein